MTLPGLTLPGLALLAAAASAPAPAFASVPAPGAGDGVIRCPDWERYAPPVVLAGAADGQTPAAFDDAVKRAANPAGNSARKADAPRGGSPNAGGAARCSHRVAEGETLGTIAAAALGSQARWRELQRANPGIDPLKLRVGATLALPCPPSADDAANPPMSSGGLLARIFGNPGRPAAGGASGEAGAGRAGDGAVSPPAASSPAANAKDGTGASPAAGRGAASRRQGAAETAPPAPPEPPLPVWAAKKGEFLADVLKRWGGEADWTIVVDTTDAWKLRVPVKLRATFEDAVAELVRGLGHDGVPPRVRLYPNDVLRLGGPP